MDTAIYPINRLQRRAAQAVYTALTRQILAEIEHDDAVYLLQVLEVFVGGQIDVLDQIAHAHRREWPALAVLDDAGSVAAEIRECALEIAAARSERACAAAPSPPWRQEAVSPEAPEAGPSDDKWDGIRPQ